MEANDEAKVTVQDKEEADLELSKQRKKGEGGIWLTLVDFREPFKDCIICIQYIYIIAAGETESQLIKIFSKDNDSDENSAAEEDDKEQMTDDSGDDSSDVDNEDTNVQE